MTMEGNDASVLVTTLILISLLIGLTWMTGCAPMDQQGSASPYDALASQCDDGSPSACIEYQNALSSRLEPITPRPLMRPPTMSDYAAPYRLQPFAPSYMSTPMGNSTIFRPIP